MWKRIKTILNSLKIGLAIGMKTADEQIMHIDGVADDKDNGIHQQQDDHRVAKHLLKGEITQEVQELVYRTTLIERESDSVEVYSPYKGIKTDKKNNGRHTKIYNKEKYKILTIQENKAIGDNVNEAISKVETDKIQTNEHGEISYNIGKLQNNHRYTIKIERTIGFTPRYRIEEYTKKIVCFIVNEERNLYIIDFYVTKYPNDKDRKSKGFVREIEYIKNDRRRSDVTDIKNMEFATSHAYNFYNGILFRFNNLQFKEVLEYDGNYIIRYGANVDINGKDFFDEQYSESMAKKYETKAAKDQTTINIDPYSENEIREYTCSICGRKVRYSAQNIDEKEASEEVEKDGADTTEFMDMENTQQLFGKKVCKDCLNKHKAELLAKYLEEKKE